MTKEISNDHTVTRMLTAHQLLRDTPQRQARRKKSRQKRLQRMKAEIAAILTGDYMPTTKRELIKKVRYKYACYQTSSDMQAPRPQSEQA